MFAGRLERILIEELCFFTHLSAYGVVETEKDYVRRVYSLDSQKMATVCFQSYPRTKVRMLESRRRKLQSASFPYMRICE